MARLTLIGLGPGDPALLTLAARDQLEQHPRIYSPTPQHPALAPVQARVQPLPTDPTAALEHPEACIALAGTPTDHPALLARLAPVATLHQIVGVSITATWQAAVPELGPAHHYRLPDLLDGDWLAGTALHSTVQPWSITRQIGDYPAPTLPYPLHTTAPALIWLLPTPQPTPATRLLELLQMRYPVDHPLILLTLDAQGRVAARHSTTLADLPAHLPDLHTLDGQQALALPTLPLAQQRRSTAALEWVVARLLGAGGCPWDVQQSPQSLRKTLLEETYEVLEVLDAPALDAHALSEELGDLLLQVFVQSEMARQARQFALEDVLEQITSKLIRRHPHVFGDLTVDDIGTVLHNWEQIKAQELQARGRARTSLLDGVPRALPALATAQQCSSKAARLGFDWEHLAQVWGSLDEERAELVQAYAAWQQHPTAATRAHLIEEYGDMLYAAVQLARWFNIDAESALREANAKFCRRFHYVERELQRSGRSLDSMSIAEWMVLWQAAKQQADQHEAPPAT